MRGYNKLIAIILVTAMIFTIWSVKDISILQASSDPTVTLYIHGEKAEGGPIFNSIGNMGEGVWSPGYSQSGVMRIYNNYSNKIRIGNLSLTIRLKKPNGELYQLVDDENLLQSYAKAMKLTIKKGKYLVFNDTIFDQSFYEMICVQGSDTYKGFTLPSTNKFSIGKNNFADLEYTVSMDESAGNDLQGLKATVDFMINADQYREDSGGGQDNNDDNGPLVEEPVIEIPDTGGGHTDYATKYPDIKGHWAYDSIAGLLDEGIITGYPDGSIRPDNYITRVEAAMLISRALGLKGSDAPSPYKDRIPDWANPYVTELYEKGIMIGVDHDRFSPNTTITREEVATILARMYKLDLDDESKVEIDDLEGWSIKYVKAVFKNKIMPVFEVNKFKPKQKMTRAQTMDLVYKAIKQTRAIK